MKLPKMSPRHIVVALCWLFIAVILSGCGQAKPKTPEEAFKQWLNYQKEKRYDAAWNMMTPELKNRRGIRGFHVGLLTAGWRGDYTEFIDDKGLIGFGDESGYAKDIINLVDKWQVKQEGNQAILSYTVPYRGFDWHLEAILVSEQGSWQVTGFYAVGYLPPGSNMKWIE